jgi:hypothetical protein
LDGLETMNVDTDGPVSTASRSESWRVHYPWPFVASFLLVTGSVIFLSLLCFHVEGRGIDALGLGPDVDDVSRRNCAIELQRLSNRMVFVFVMICVSAVGHAVIAIVPSAAMVVAEMRSGHLGRSYRAMCQALLEGPLVVGGIASFWLWVFLVGTTACTLDGRLVVNSAIGGAVVCCFGLGLAHSMDKLLRKAAHRAPLGCIDYMQTAKYNNPFYIIAYPVCNSEYCPICLGEWALGDDMTFTPCKHAFHTECLRVWLTIHRTCAMCRQDVTKVWKSSLACPELQGTE